jgi:SAM-dependent methyltransferase
VTGLAPAAVQDLTRAIVTDVERGNGVPGLDVRASLDRSAIRRGDVDEFLDCLGELEPNRQKEFAAAIDDVQVRSKLWLIDEVTALRSLEGATITVLGAWYGILPLLLNWRLERPPEQVVCIDVDAGACALGEQVVGAVYPNVRYRVADVMDLDHAALLTAPSPVLVNTVCEHLARLGDWWRLVPEGTFCVLQSNNYGLCRDHVNWVHDTAEMKGQTPMSRVLLQGTLPLGLFDRFMLIGYR